MLFISYGREFLILFFQVILIVVIIEKATVGEKVNLKEGLWALLIGLGVVLFMLATRGVGNVFADALGISVLVIATIFYVHKKKKYTLRKAISLSFMGYFFYFINDTLVLVFLSYMASRINENLYSLIVGNLFPVLHVFLLYTQTLLLLIVIKRLKKVKRWRKRIGENIYIQNILANFNIALFLILVSALLFFELREEFVRAYQWLLMGGIILVLYVILISYFAYISAKLIRMQQESELKTLKYYVDEIEQQSTQIRQFKHDYQNILLSLEGYIRDREYEELESFFYESILKTARAVEGKNMRLEDIRNIKSKEVKSILVAKIQKAISLNIDIEFVARDEIESIPLEPITLIRIIGILLDNAIEAVQEIQGGKILVGILKREQEICLLVQNTCDPKEVEFNAIYQKGHSSKGPRRGIGLVNLSEFTRKYENIFLKTEIEGDQFIQMVTIES